MAAPAPRKSGVVIPQRLPWHRQLAASAIAFLLWCCIKTWRTTWTEKSDAGKTEAPVIYCVWHNRLGCILAGYKNHAFQKWDRTKLAALVSASRDGAFLSVILGRFGIQSIRGSTSRRGPQALLEAARWLRKGCNVAITPDGPRGPSQQIQDGIIYLAQVSGRPIVPVSAFARRKIYLRSWDRFQVPLPFTHCDFYENAPLWVPRNATETDRQQLRSKLQAAMQAITRD